MESRSRSFRTVISSATVILHANAKPAGRSLWLRELTQEADIVLKENLNVVDLVFEHGEAVDAHAEGEATDFFGVVVDEPVDGRIDHACTEEFDPAGAFAFRARAAGGACAAAAAEDAGDVELDARLGEREIAGAEAGFYPVAEELFYEILDGAGEVAEGDVGIDRQAFDLMENEGVRGVGIVAAIDLAGDDDPHGRLALFHGADLHGRCVRAEKQRRRGAFREIEVEGVHVVADRMEFGNVKRLEIVIGRFDFGAFDDGEADGDEDVFDLLEDLADEVMRAGGTFDAREREVDVVVREGGLVGAGFNGLAAGFDLGFHVGAKFVEAGAGRAFEIGRGGFEPVVGDLREHTGFAAEPGVAENFPAGFVVNGSGFGVEARADSGKVIRNCGGGGYAESGESRRGRIFDVRHKRNSLQRRGTTSSCPFRNRREISPWAGRRAGSECERKSAGSPGSKGRSAGPGQRARRPFWPAAERRLWRWRPGL